MNATVTTLQQHPVFRAFSASALAELSKLIGVEQFPRGEFLFREGTRQEALYLLTRGEVHMLHGAGAELMAVAVLGEGDIAGEGVLLGDEIHFRSGRATVDVSAVVIGRDTLEALMQREPAAGQQLLREVGAIVARRSRASHLGHRVGARYIRSGGAQRLEHDLLGEREVPVEAYFGIQTLRALENFQITGIPLNHFPNFVKALAMVKKAAASANRELGHLPPEIAGAIDQACDDIIGGGLHNHFLVDMIQGGAGTSTNMNANEVIANRALELLGHPKGAYAVVHPNNHVNLSQSTNDAYPTAINLAILLSHGELIEAMEALCRTFDAKAAEFAAVIKMGRTQLQDAVPMTLGQEFAAYAATVREDIDRVKELVRLFREINLGGTAIGTGINTDPAYAGLAVRELARVSGIEFVGADDLVEATSDMGAFVVFSGVLKRIAVKISKICNDLRLLSSGPRAGFNEINLPPMQPGSSIMPGKVNPVIPEVVNQVAYQVIGNDLTITMAAESGQLQLNVMEPVIAFNLLQSLRLMTQAMQVLAERCVGGISANVDHCRRLVENSIGLVTAVNPYIGYENATRIAKRALETGRGVKALILEEGLLTPEQLEDILKPENMTRPRRFTGA